MANVTRPVVWMLIAVLVSSCGGSVARRGDAAPTPGARNIGGGLDLPDDEPDAAADPNAPPEGASAASTQQSFVLRVVDQNGGHPAGIPIEIRGTKTMDAVSDASGTVLVEGPPGYYTFKVPVRCGDDIDVRSGGTGRFGIAEGQQGSGEVEAHWQHRYAPSAPAFSSIGPYWPVGDTVRIRYDLVDRCSDQGRAVNRPFPTYAYEPAANLRVLGTPEMRSDDKGFAWVEVECTAEGETSLVVYDTANPSDRLDLVQVDASGRPPSCRRL